MFTFYRGRVELVCIPLGHAGTNINDAASDIEITQAQVRPSIAAIRKQKERNTLETSKTALLHDMRISKTFLDKLLFLAQTRLLGIIGH
jgi:hypothetical protein